MRGRPSAATLALLWAALVAVFWGGLVVPGMQPGLRRLMDMDLYGYFVPKFWYGNRELLAGRLPLWNPWEYGGLPFLGAAQPAALYPPKIVVYALAGGAATHAYMALHYLLAGVVAFIAFGGLGLGWAGAALGTVTWVFSPLNMESHYHPFRLACLTWVPLVFLCFVRLLERPGARAAAALAAAAALTLLAGYPEYALDTGVSVLVFWLVAGRRLAPCQGRALGWLVASGFLAGALVALQVVSLAEMAGESVRAARVAAPLTAARLADLAVLADPRVLGAMARGFTQWFHLAPLAWLLAVMGVLLGRAPFRLAFLALWVTTVALGSVLNGPLHHLPVFSLLRGNYAWVGLAYLPAAYLAGAGLDAVFDARGAVRPGRGRLVAAGAICLGSLPLVGARSWPWLALGLVLLAGARASVAWRAPAVLALVGAVAWALWAWNPASFTAPLPHRFARGEPPYPSEPPHATGLAGRLRGACGPAPVRLLAPGLIWDGAAVTERVELVQGYPESIAPARLQRLLGELGLDPEHGLWPDWQQVAAHGRLLDLLNVGCVLVPGTVDGGRFELTPAGTVGHDVLYRRAHPLPRAFLVQHALAAPDAEAAWQALLRPGFDPSREAILEGVEAPPAGGSGTVDVVEGAPGELALAVTTPEPALVVVAQTYFPGWRAHVDGREVPVRRADYVAMALAVPAGNHHVILRYGSRAVHAASALSALALLATVALLARRGTT